MALRAIRIDISGEEDRLQKENAYFDATHTRVHRFKSFALWLIHGPMREMLRLASMEMRSENTNDISIFFTLFNEVLEQVSGIKGYKFNPRCFMCDEGGTNHRAVREVYGEEFCRDQVRGCQFHFKQQVQKQKHQIPEESRDQFIQICNKLCLVTTVARYEILKGKLEEMARRTPSLWSWVEWWDIRKAHIFGPLHHGSLPGCNLSEQGNKSWKPTATMRLVHAACDDTITMMFQEMQVKKIITK